MLYSTPIGKRLAIGWTLGTVVSALGICFSVRLDLPTGPTMVCTFGLMGAFMAVAKTLVTRLFPRLDLPWGACVLANLRA